MFGGPPMMPAPQYAPQYAIPSQPMPQYNVPAALASAPARPSQPMTTTPQRAQPLVTTTPQRAQPLVRAQAPDEPRPAANRVPVPSTPPVAERTIALHLPAPEEIGVTAPGTVDWSNAHARLEKLGCTCFHEEKLANGACRVSCVLPSPGGAHEHRVEAEASNETEAMQVVLAEAERWMARK
jgi:hypothetical protein